MYLLHNRVPIRIVGKRAGAALESFAPVLRCRQAPDLHLDLFTGGQSEILAQLNCPAVDSAMHDLGHMKSIQATASKKATALFYQTQRPSLPHIQQRNGGPDLFGFARQEAADFAGGF